MATPVKTPRERAAITKLCEFAEWMEKRDLVVIEAYWDGVNKHQIHVLTGIARTTIDRIIARLDDRS